MSCWGGSAISNTSLFTKDKMGCTTIVQRIQAIAEKQPLEVAQHIKSREGIFTTRNYKEFMHEVYKTAHFLHTKLKVERGDKIALISQNRPEWLLFDLAILGLGAADVPRGNDTVAAEIAYILQHSEAKGAIFEDVAVYQLVKKRNPKIIEQLSFVLFLDTPENYDTQNHKKEKISIHFYQDIIDYEINTSAIHAMKDSIASRKIDDLATIIYTSGTTAHPKGVCLSHKGFLFQIDAIVPKVIQPEPQYVFLSMLPLWHAYERAIQYIALASGSSIAYSKPIGKILLEDLQTVQAHVMTSVPRIWEGVYAAIHRKIRNGSIIKKYIFKIAVTVGKKHAYLKHILYNTYIQYTDLEEKGHVSRSLEILKTLPLFLMLFPIRLLLDALVFKKIRVLLGKRFLAGVSGGGALPEHIDWFFQAANIKILDGYGLTETSPILSVRNQKRPEANSIGKMLAGVEYKVVDEKTGHLVPYGTPGVLHVRSPQVMQCYYKDPKATAAILNKDGWLNTGDIIVHDSNGAIKIVGRSTETLVLKTGENVSPTRVENILKASEYVDNVIIFGQDQKYIVALIVPDFEMLKEYAQNNEITYESNKQISESNTIRTLMSEIVAETNTHLNAYERVVSYAILPCEFEVGVELTQTLKLKRHFIRKKYEAVIKDLY